ncbi:hypothetical protein C1H46_031857 [Malus baccata]|uniref:Pentacotripeptide-repeat region of PRORP domain-containing protein n=1 Tax=Malus baccata TaxID=106549 RepID=A0A540L7Z3_MALBA|nr:hypothetical protein C1H46_031857 [Malus baccata]
MSRVESSSKKALGPRFAGWLDWFHHLFRFQKHNGRLLRKFARVANELASQSELTLAILYPHNHPKLTNLLLRCAAQLTMRHLYQIQAQLLTNPIPSIDPNIIAVKLIAVSAAHANPRHAALLFNHHLKTPNIFSYNALLKAFAQNNDWQNTIYFFNRQLGSPDAPDPDEYTFTSVLKACAGIARVAEGEKVHCFVSKYGCESNLFVRNSLTDMYFKVGNFGIAQKLFDEMSVRDVVSWNTLVSGYCSSGQVEKARWVFDGMEEKTLFSWSTMISAYAKAGELEVARRLFDEMPERNVVSWNAMIAGYAQNEKYAEAIEVFRQMQQCGVTPNDVTLISVLSACAHLGALDLGKWIDRFIRRNGMELVWGALLGGCRIYKDSERGERVVQRILELDSDHSGSYVYLANVYTSMGRLDDAASCRLQMRDKGVSKTPGCSWIEVDNIVHEFFMGDLSHPQMDKVYSMIRELRRKMKLAGFRNIGFGFESERLPKLDVYGNSLMYTNPNIYGSVNSTLFTC